MAENLGQIDVVIKNDSQSLPAPGQTPGGQGGGGQGGGEPGGPGFPGVGTGVMAGRAMGMGIGKGALLLGAAGLLIGGLGVAVAMTIKTLKKWTSELANTTKRLAHLNSNAALAGVIEEFGEFRRNLSLGRVLGPTMLSVARLRDRIQDNLQPLKETYALLKAKAVENFMALIVVVTKRLGQLGGVLESITSFLTETFDSLMTMISKIGRSLFMYGRSLGLAGDVLGLTQMGYTLTKIVELMDALRSEMKDAKEDARSKDEFEEAKLANAELLSSLQQLTGGFWRHDTQTIGALGTGQTLNPRGFEERERNRGS